MFSITSQPFYDSFSQTYKNIYVTDQKPIGPIINITKKMRPPILSPFKSNSDNHCYNKCIFAFINPENNQEFLCIEDLSTLFNFLIINNYTIDTSLTQMMNQSKVEFKKNFVCFVKYNGL